MEFPPDYDHVRMKETTQTIVDLILQSEYKNKEIIQIYVNCIINLFHNSTTTKWEFETLCLSVKEMIDFILANYEENRKIMRIDNEG